MDIYTKQAYAELCRFAGSREDERKIEAVLQELEDKLIRKYWLTDCPECGANLDGFKPKEEEGINE